MNKVGALIKRNTKIYLRDRAAVFFSFMSVLIVFMLYVLFIGNNIKQGMETLFTSNNLPVDKTTISLYADSWMMGGIIGVGCVTITNGCMMNFVHDTMHNIRDDFFVTPMNRIMIILSYFCSTVIITFCMSMLMFIIIYAYLLINGMAMLAFLDLLTIFAIILLSTISASVIALLLSVFVKTDSAHGALIGITTALSGFLTGAYMPLSLFPNAIAYACLLHPATGTVVLMRRLMMKPVLAEMTKKYPTQLITNLNNEYTLNVFIGSHKVPIYLIIIYILATTLIFVGILALAIRRYKRK